MINFNPNINPASIGKINFDTAATGKINDAGEGKFSETMKAAEKYISSVDESQQATDASIKDLLTGKNEDVLSVVSAVAKADMSFKLLVGVRNKLVEAYKQTMNMPI